MTRSIRLLSIACAVLLLAGVVSLFVVDDDGDEVATDGTAADFDTEAGSGADDADATEATTGDDDPENQNDDGEDGEEGDGDTAQESADDEATSEDDEAGETDDDSDAVTTTAPAPATTSAPTTTDRSPALGTTPTQPGTYRYRITGTADGQPVDGTSELVVSTPDADGRQRQRQAGPEGDSTTTYRFTPDGTYLESMTMSAQGTSITLTATSPFLAIPAGATAGTRTTGTLTGSGLTAVVTFTLTAVDGNRSTATIEADISGRVLNACNVDGTLDSTVIARTSDQLPLDTTSMTDINISGGLLCPGRIQSNTRAVYQG